MKLILFNAFEMERSLIPPPPKFSHFHLGFIPMNLGKFTEFIPVRNFMIITRRLLYLLIKQFSMLLQSIVFPFTWIGTSRFMEVGGTDGRILASQPFGLFDQFLTLKASVPNCISCLVAKEDRLE